MDKVTVQRLINAYNKNAKYYNKIRKKLVKLSQNDTKEGRMAYKQLALIYRKAITDRKRAADAVKLYLITTTSKKTIPQTLQKKKPTPKR